MESKEYISTVSQFFLSFSDLIFSLPLYKIFPTKSFKSVVNCQRSLLLQTNKFIDKKLAEIAEEDRRALEAASGEEEAPDKVDFITYLVHSGKLNVNEVSANIMDILSAGVETVSVLSCFDVPVYHYTETSKTSKSRPFLVLTK